MNRKDGRGRVIATRATWRAVVVRLAVGGLAYGVRRACGVRCPAINTRRTSAPVDFGQSFADESVRLRGGDGGGEREAVMARARRVAERTLRSEWVGFKAAEG